jgi:predicted GNAT family acetyltransferase
MSDVIDNTAAHRLEINDGGHVAFLTYRMKGDAVEYLHSETPPELQGRGYASALAKFALDRERASGRKVIPSCPFVRAYIQRHPEYESVILKG